jgi:haloalkane dehalogenase
VAAWDARAPVPARPTWLDESLYPFESRYLTLEGHRIHYIDEGSGPVLLFLHANPLWSFQYRNMITALRGRFRCIALDYPGFGLSSAALGHHATLLGTSLLVERFIEELALTGITLVCHDTSCAIGLGVVVRHAEWFKGLVISNGFAWPLEEYPGIYRFIKVAGSRPFRFLIVNFNLLVRLTVKTLKGGQLTAAERAAYLGPFAAREVRHHQHDLFWSIGHSYDYLSDLQRRLSALQDMPVLLQFADGDSTYRAGFLSRFERMFPRHRSVIITDLPKGRSPGQVAHFPQEYAAEQMARALGDWWVAELAK